MGRAEDLIRNRQDDEEIDRLHKFLKETIHKHFLRIDKVVENFSEEEIIELTDYIRYFAKNHGEKTYPRMLVWRKCKHFYCYFVN